MRGRPRVRLDLPSAKDVGRREYNRLWRRAKFPPTRQCRTDLPKLSDDPKEYKRLWMASRRRDTAYRAQEKSKRREYKRGVLHAKPSQQWYAAQTSPFIAAGLTIGDPRRMRPSDWREDAAQDRILADLEAKAKQRGKAA